MSCDIQNNSGQDMSALTNMVKRFYPYAQEYLGFDKPAQIVYASDTSNGDDPLGKTAHYQPDNYTVTLYVDGRHPKDLLRSLAHELVHHTQNCRGDLSPEKMGETGDGYAQTDGHLRKMEQEAYASMVMRDWEDQYKSKRRNNLHETNYINKEYITMSEHEKLVQSIVAEIMKHATITTGGAVNEEEEEDDVQEEGQGDRNDKDREQGRASSDRRQGTSSGGGSGQNLEEGEDEDEEPVEEGLADAKSPPHRDPKTGKKCYNKQGNQVKCGTEEAVRESQDEDEEPVEEGLADAKSPPHRDPKTGKKCYNKQGNQVQCGTPEAVRESQDEDEEVKEEGASPDVSKHRSAGTIEEAEDDEENTDDLQETFQRRNNKLYERLLKRWAK